MSYLGLQSLSFFGGGCLLVAICHFLFAPAQAQTSTHLCLLTNLLYFGSTNEQYIGQMGSLFKEGWHLYFSHVWVDAGAVERFQQNAMPFCLKTRQYHLPTSAVALSLSFSLPGRRVSAGLGCWCCGKSLEATLSDPLPA